MCQWSIYSNERAYQPRCSSASIAPPDPPFVCVSNRGHWAAETTAHFPEAPYRARSMLAAGQMPFYVPKIGKWYFRGRQECCCMTHLTILRRLLPQMTSQFVTRGGGHNFRHLYFKWRQGWEIDRNCSQPVLRINHACMTIEHRC